MNTVQSPEFARNYGFWEEEEQQRLGEAHVAIGGVGGDGFQLGQKLARMGVRTFDVADPEVFEPENANRVPAANLETYGRKKAEVFREEVLKINKDADVRIYEEGVTPDNVGDFLSRATLVFDETELTYPHIGTAIAREARQRNIPDVLVMNVGFAATVTSFHPESSWTFERFMGIPEDMPLDEVAEQEVDFRRCLPYIPKYADLRTLQAVQEGASLPSISAGVDIASAIGSTQAFKHIMGGTNKRDEPVWAPEIAWMDAYTLEGGRTKMPRFSHYRHLAHAAVRQALGRNPDASYTATERLRRQILQD